MAGEMTVRIRLGPHVVERMQEICEYLNLSPAAFAAYAVEQEVNRQELNRIKDEITIQEIGKYILKEGQSLNIDVEVEGDGGPLSLATCQMCLRDFTSPTGGVEGPTFCRECLSLAKGGDFSKVAIGE